MTTKIHLPDSVKTALDLLTNNGYEGFIVGGCVRDSLLGFTPKDYDITTSALPEQTKFVFKNYRVIETGIKHGTVTVLIDNMPLEITTYRIDSDYKDNRRPESVTFTASLEEDTARRDFTMNSIAYSEQTGIKDYYGGENDIRSGIIRCVGDPYKRFGEDALRIMRAVRFSSVLGFAVEEQTKAAVFGKAELLKNISSERIAAELMKLLCGKNVREVLLEYIDVLGTVIPELMPMKGFEQHNIHHIYDVWEHTAKAVESAEPEPTLRLAVLLHDIGKPHTFSITDGVGHFYGHAKVSCELAKTILDRLKLDNRTKDTVIELIRLHDVQIPEEKTAVKRFMNRHTPELFFELIKLKRADTLAQNPDVFYRLEYLDRLNELGRSILAEQSCFSLKDLAVNGSDLIAMGVAPGRTLGNILNALLEEVIAERLPNDKQKLLEYVQKTNSPRT